MEVEPSTDLVDSLELYISTPTVPACTDPIAYWHGLRRSEVSVSLAQMAIDYLSAPGEYF
jgi:hypothetical protein